MSDLCISVRSGAVLPDTVLKHAGFSWNQCGHHRGMHMHDPHLAVLDPYCDRVDDSIVKNAIWRNDLKPQLTAVRHMRYLEALYASWTSSIFPRMKNSPSGMASTPPEMI